MKVLVTGGAGFVGSHLAVALLQRGFQVRVLDNFAPRVTPGVELMLADVRSFASVSEAVRGIDCVVHLAAISSVQACSLDPVMADEVNVQGTVNVLEAAAAATNGPLRVIYASSAAVYGDTQRLPLVETEAPKPLSEYGRTKLQCELHANRIAKGSGLTAVGLRLFNVFGISTGHTGQTRGVVANFLNRLEQGQPVHISGSGRQTRDFVFIDDVCRSIICAMKVTRTSLFNVCGGVETSISQLADEAASASGGELRIEYGPVERGSIFRSYGCPKYAQRELNFTPRISLRDGLRATLRQMRQAI